MESKHDCRKCRRYAVCVDIDQCRNQTMLRNIDRIDNPTRKYRLEITYFHDLPESEYHQIERTIYGDTNHE